MIVGFIVSSASLVVVVLKIISTEQNKVQIISVFTMMDISQLHRAYDICDMFIDRIDSIDEGNELSI